MVKAVDDADPAVKLPALQTLAEGGAAAVPALVEHGHPQGRYWATLVLAEVGPPAKDAVPALTKLLEDQDSEVRMQVAMALGAIGVDAASAPRWLRRSATRRLRSAMPVRLPWGRSARPMHYQIWRRPKRPTIRSWP